MITVDPENPPSGQYVDVPVSVIEYIQAYVGGHNNNPVGNWDGCLILDSVKNRVMLIPNSMPMDLDYDWMEPQNRHLRKVMRIITETIVPVTNVMKERQALAIQHLVVWMVEADWRKACDGPWNDKYRSE